MVDFENRNAAYVRVREYRKRRKSPFAGRHHLNINRPYCGTGFGFPLLSSATMTKSASVTFSIRSDR